MSLLILRVREPITRMEDTQIIRELHVAFLEVERDGVFLGEKVQRVERFGLRFGDGWDICRARKALETGECAARVLDYEALRRCGGGGLVMQEWAGHVWFGFVTEAELCQ